MTSQSLRRFCLGLFLLVCSAASSAQTLEINKGFEQVNLVPYLSLLQDPEQVYSLQDVRQKTFVEHSQENFYFHFSKSAYWFRFQLKNTSEQPQTLWLVVKTSWIDQVELFTALKATLQESGIESEPDTEAFISAQAGDHVERSLWPWAHPKLVFPVQIAPQSELEGYLRVSGEDALTLPISLYSSEAAAKADVQYHFLFGMILGIFAVMALYNLMLYLYLQDKIYLDYSLYIFFFGSMIALVEGLVNPFLNLSSWVLEHLYLLAMMGYFVFMLSFTRRFLDTQLHHAVIDKVLKAAIWVYGITAFSVLIVPYPIAMEFGVITATLVPFLMLIPGILLYRQGHATAKFYLASWIPNTIGYVIWASAFFGFLPSNTLTANANALGAMLEFVIFSLALAYRIDSLHKEKEQLTHALTIDPLTKVFNRRMFDEYLSQQFAEQIAQPKSGFSMILIDIDHFKLVNDTHGHAVGDVVLHEVAKRLSSKVSNHGILARWGGEEFVCVLSSSQDIEEFCEGLLEAVRHKPIPSVGRITISIGATTVLEEDSPSTLFMRCDRNLYQAKQQGRNCAVIDALNAEECP